MCIHFFWHPLYILPATETIYSEMSIYHNMAENINIKKNNIQDTQDIIPHLLKKFQTGMEQITSPLSQ
jgi:hypothetical protein